MINEDLEQVMKNTRRQTNIDTIWFQALNTIENFQAWARGIFDK